MLKKMTLVFFLIGFELYSAPLKPYVYNGNYDHLSLYYQYIEDCNFFSDQEVLELFRNDNFNYYPPNKTFNKGLTRCSYWLAVEILNTSPKSQKFLWSFYNNGLSFSFYELKNGGLVFLEKASMQQAIKQRPYPVRSISYPFYLQSNENKVLFVKVTPTVNGNVYFPTDLTDIEDYLWYEIDFSYLLGKYFGVLLFALFSNFCMLFILKERLYFYNMLFVFFVILFELSDFHFDSLQIPSYIFPYWSAINKEFYISFALFFYIKVFQLFTDIRLHFSKINSIISKYNYILLFCTFISFGLCYFRVNSNATIHVLNVCINSINDIGFLLLFLAIVFGVIKGKRYFYLFGAASLFLLYGFISYLLNTINIFYLPILNPGNIINGLVFESSLLTIFFVYKFKIEKENAARKIIKEIRKNEKLTKKMLDIEEIERERMAKNIHDDIGSEITALRLQMQNQFIRSTISASQKEKMLSSTREIYEKVRTISQYLKPIDFYEDFIEIIENQINFYKNNVRTITFDFFTNIKNSKIVKSEIQNQLIRIIKEICLNAIKHSLATTVVIQLMHDDKMLILFIEDNGIGFNTKQHSKSIGIKNIYSRVEFLKGTITLESSKNGTSYIVEIPL
jgi:signal transduction histidine kinase